MNPEWGCTGQSDALLQRNRATCRKFQCSPHRQLRLGLKEITAGGVGKISKSFGHDGLTNSACASRQGLLGGGTRTRKRKSLAS